MICDKCKKQIYPKSSTAYNVEFACDCKVTGKTEKIDEIINELHKKHFARTEKVIEMLENLKKGG